MTTDPTKPTVYWRGDFYYGIHVPSGKPNVMDTFYPYVPLQYTSFDKDGKMIHSEGPYPTRERMMSQHPEYEHYNHHQVEDTEFAGYSDATIR